MTLLNTSSFVVIFVRILVFPVVWGFQVRLKLYASARTLLQRTEVCKMLANGYVVATTTIGVWMRVRCFRYIDIAYALELFQNSANANATSKSREIGKGRPRVGAIYFRKS